MANYGHNTEGGYHAIYLLDFYVGGHHIFKVGMSANPYLRANHITTSLYQNNASNIQAPLYKFVNDIVHWKFKSVWKTQSKGAHIESLLLEKLKNYSDSLHSNNQYGGRDWNKFEGMYEAYPIRTKDVYWMKNSLEKIVNIETDNNSFFIKKESYEASLNLTFNPKNINKTK
jgi:hypothetical protein